MVRVLHISYIESREHSIGVIHKPRGQEGTNQMTTLLHKPYLVKVSTKGIWKVSKVPKKLLTWCMDDPYDN